MRTRWSLLACLLFCSPASAQLVASAEVGDGAYHINVDTGQATLLWGTTSTINALTVDEVSRRTWLVSIFVLRFWDYYEPNQGFVGPLEVLNGMAMANGVLYGVTDANPRIVTVDIAGPPVTPVVSLPSDWVVDDLAWDSRSRELYFPVVSALIDPLGVYRIEPAGGALATFVTAFPAGYTQVTGLAVGGGKIWILQPGLPIRSYDMGTGVWDPVGLPNPVSGSAHGAMDWSGRMPLRVAYCTAKTSPVGCVPTMEVLSGYASAGSTSGFSVAAQGVRNETTGLLLYGLAGAASLPFEGGTLCLATPLSRGVPLGSGGSPKPIADCSGTWRLDLNAFAAGLLGGNPRRELSAYGTTVHCQWWGRDPLDPFGSQLSNALRYDVEP